MLSRPAAISVLVLGCVAALAGGLWVAERQSAPADTSTSADGPIEIPLQDPSSPMLRPSGPPGADRGTGDPSSPSGGDASTAAAGGAGMLGGSGNVGGSGGTAAAAGGSPGLAADAGVSGGGPALGGLPEMPGLGAGRPSRPVIILPPQPPPTYNQQFPQTGPQWGPVPGAAPGATVAEAAPPPPPKEYEDVKLPAGTVIDVTFDTAVSSAEAKVEDKVVVKVTRDVKIDDRVVVPAGSKVVGTVGQVETGSKVKSRALIAVTFDKLALPGSPEASIFVNAIIEKGDSPAKGGLAKTGTAVLGGVITGVLLGGQQGAMLGGAAGAASGAAGMMGGQPIPAVIPAGARYALKLTNDATVKVEKKAEKKAD